MVWLLSQVALPDSGIDLAGYAQSAMTELGPVVLAAVSAWFGFAVVRAGVRWARDMF